MWYPDGSSAPYTGPNPHTDHLHIHTRRQGGPIPGSGRGDKIPILAEPGEHVLTRSDVAALGGQSGVYALRSMLHRQVGGDIKAADVENYWTDFAPGPGPGYRPKQIWWGE